jgi:hypothetical protein
MKVLTRMFEYVCGRCGCTYRAAQVASGYGIIGFWDASGRYLAVVDGIGDSLFDRVTAALARHPAAPEISDRRRGRVVQWVIAHLSDLAPSGLPLTQKQSQPARTVVRRLQPSGNRWSLPKRLSLRYFLWPGTSGTA